MRTTRYLPVALSVYINYAMLGIATIIISQYSDYFQNAWSTNLSGISKVISIVGIGRIITILFAGPLSDKLGRKKIAIASCVSVLLFFCGLILSHSLFVAYIAALFFGLAQSVADASCYPILTEAFQEKAPSMMPLVKASMSIAQFILPFFVAAFSNAIPLLIIFSVIVIFNAVFFAFCKYAPQTVAKIEEKAKIVGAKKGKSVSIIKRSIWFDGVPLIFIGFSSVFTFYLFMQYMPTFGTSILHLSSNGAASLVSWYAAASLISVFLISFIVVKVKPIIVVILYPFITVIFLIALVLVPSVTLARITGIVVGFFAAGGVWQLGLSILTSYFPTSKGKVTSFYSFAAACCYYVGPALCAVLITNKPESINKVFWLDIIVTWIGIAAAIIVFLRDKMKNKEFVG
ncbi:MAG: MFS transporter [Sporolactobacillus sp.]